MTYDVMRILATPAENFVSGKYAIWPLCGPIRANCDTNGQSGAIRSSGTELAARIGEP